MTNFFDDYNNLDWSDTISNIYNKTKKYVFKTKNNIKVIIDLNSKHETNINLSLLEYTEKYNILNSDNYFSLRFYFSDNNFIKSLILNIDIIDPIKKHFSVIDSIHVSANKMLTSKQTHVILDPYIYNGYKIDYEFINDFIDRANSSLNFKVNDEFINILKNNIKKSIGDIT